MVVAIKFLLLVCVGYAQAIMSDDEVKLEFMKIVFNCIKDHPVPITEIVELNKLVTPTDMRTKCLLACAYKRAKSLNEKGKYDVEENYKIAEKTKGGDDKALKNAKKLVDLCAKVNEVEVNDGEKGCERASLIFACTIENAPKFGFKV